MFPTRFNFFQQKWQRVYGKLKKSKTFKINRIEFKNMQVEVWDVVDIAKKRKKLSGLKVGPGVEAETFEPGLDAQFLDVYKQAHGVIIIFDITKPWTFDYTKKELDNVPTNIPVLVLANFCDASHHRQVTKLQVADFIENFQRKGTDPAEVISFAHLFQV